MLVRIKRFLFRAAVILLIVCAGVTIFPPLDGERAVVTLEFLGSFHPAFLHIPIGLWFGVLLLLLADTLGRQRSLNSYLFGGGCVTLLTGLIAYVTGANLFLAGSYDRDTLAPHMYGALFFLVGVLVFCVLVDRKAHPFFLWLTAIGSMAVLSFAGHVGGVITHGDPMKKAPWIVLKQQTEEQALKLAARKASAKDPFIFEHVVMPILESKCINCHGTTRAKGKLRMDSFEALVQGGSNGPSLVPGNIKKSLMLERVHLPMHIKEHMPPEDKEQLTPDELAFLEWWVLSAADPKLKVSKTKFPDEIKPLIAAFTGDSPEAIQRRQDRELKALLFDQHQTLSATFPGIVIQAVQGETRFELNSASMYGIDEAALRELIKPFTPYLVRIDWHNRAMDPEWMDLLSTCSNLEVLNIKQSDISEAALVTMIERNPKLHTLNFYGVAVSDQLIPTIKPRMAQGQLVNVNLSETKLSPEGLKELQAAVPVVTLRY